MLIFLNLILPIQFTWHVCLSCLPPTYQWKNGTGNTIFVGTVGYSSSSSIYGSNSTSDCNHSTVAICWVWIRGCNQDFNYIYWTSGGKQQSVSTYTHNLSYCSAELLSISVSCYIQVLFLYSHSYQTLFPPCGFWQYMCMDVCVYVCVYMCI